MAGVCSARIIRQTRPTMDKVSRLFALMQILRGRQRAITAQQLAEKLSVSVRTVYRDIDALVALGATIDGSAGVGYILRSGFFLPPLMFSDEEIEVLVLGSRWVAAQGDAGLAQAAESAMGKIATASQKELRDKIAEVGLWAPRPRRSGSSSPHLGLIREAIRREHKLQLRYVDARDVGSKRVVWPIALGFFENTLVVAAWCELRGDFRHFRVDRMTGLSPQGMRYPRPRRELVRDWKRLHAAPVLP
jgi:predicted DNA-binding transcriptional regulator YafY